MTVSDYPQSRVSYIETPNVDGKPITGTILDYQRTRRVRPSMLRRLVGYGVQR
jgi:hypothetical protein